MPILHVSSLHWYYLIDGDVKANLEFKEQPTWAEVLDRLSLSPETAYGSTFFQSEKFSADSKVRFNVRLFIAPHATASEYVYAVYLSE